MASTLLLDTVAWDLVLDAVGNIAVASAPYSLSQDAASACRTFEGECYFDTDIGIPYLSEVLGQTPSLGLLKELFVAAALTVPDVQSAQCFITATSDRSVTGQIQVTPVSSTVVAAADFTVVDPQI